MRIAILVLSVTLVLTTCAVAQPYIGDYDLELRKDGRVDTDRMIQRLQDLGANTYMYLIWHRATDWEDLREFLPAAREAGITVWVYLVPPSETAAVHEQFPYSEPFRLDYVRWAEEIATLSLEHSNLVGWVIDDFWSNVQSGFFTPEYVQKFQSAAKGISPGLKFYVLLYPTWGQIGAEFAQTMGPIVDGVVAAYPRDEQAIIDVQPYLNDTWREPARLQVSFPARTPSRGGDFGIVRQTVRVTDPNRAQIRFRYSDSFGGPTAGYHFMQLHVDGQVAWEEDVAGEDDGAVVLNLRRYVRGKSHVLISFGVHDKRGVNQFPVTATFTDLEAVGLRVGDFASARWSDLVSGRFSTAMMPSARGARRFNLPLIVMPAAQPKEYENRWGVEGTPERVAERVRMGLRLVEDGHAQGVVTYCLDKSAGSEIFEAVREAFAEFQQEDVQF